MSINDFICIHHTDSERGKIVNQCPVCATAPLQKKVDEFKDELVEMHEQRRQLQKRIEELEKQQRKCPIGLDATPEICSAGTCDVCWRGRTKAQIESLEKQLLAMREAIVNFKEATDICGGHGTPIYRDRVYALIALSSAERALNSTPDDLSRKYVKREVLESLLNRIDGQSRPYVYKEEIRELMTLARKELEK